MYELSLGQAPRRLTAGRGWNVLPAYSPSGDEIAYLHGGLTRKVVHEAQMLVADVAHPARRRVVRLGAVRTHGLSLAWAGDDRLVYTVERGGQVHIYAVSMSGGVPLDLGRSRSDSMLPAIRPAGPEPAA